MYLVKIYDSTETLIDSFIYSDIVVGDTVIDKTNWYSTSHYPNDWQTNTTDGLRIRRYISGQPLLEWLEAKYPGEIAFSWQADASRRTIADTDTVVNVTPGKFSCYYYTDIEFKTKTGWEYSNIFYSPQTGMIKTDIYREKSDSVRYLYYSVELISFKKE